MKIPEDDQFELYLKQFHPIAPGRLSARDLGRTSRSLAIRAGLAAAAAMLLVGMLVLRIRSNQAFVPNSSHDAVIAQRMPPQPLTMQSANAWLATAPSFEAAVDALAFPSQTSQLALGEKSAIALLSQENIKP